MAKKDEVGQQAFTSKEERAMSQKHLADRIKIDKDHLQDHKNMAAKLNKQLTQVKRGKA